MHVHVHHQSKDRKTAVAFSASHRRILRAIPQVANMPGHPEIAHATALRAPEAFSPLIQEFLDECGYSDK